MYYNIYLSIPTSNRINMAHFSFYSIVSIIDIAHCPSMQYPCRMQIYTKNDIAQYLHINIIVLLYTSSECDNSLSIPATASSQN